MFRKSILVKSVVVLGMLVVVIILVNLLSNSLPPPLCPNSVHYASLPSFLIVRQASLEEFKSHIFSERERKAYEACIRPGDEFLYFESAPETWQNLSGRAGYAIRRDGFIISIMETRRG